MHDKNYDRKFYMTEEILLNCNFLTVLPKAVFRTQPKVYGGAFLQMTFLMTFSC